MLGGAIAGGVPAALQAALALAHEHGVSELVVEAVVPGAVHVTCSVLQGEQVRRRGGCGRGRKLPVPSAAAAGVAPATRRARPSAAADPAPWPEPRLLAPPPRQGAVALPPTELSYWDIEDEVAAAGLRYERTLAAREVRALAAVEAGAGPCVRPGCWHAPWLLAALRLGRAGLGRGLGCMLAGAQAARRRWPRHPPSLPT